MAEGFQYSIMNQSTKLSKKSEAWDFIDTYYYQYPKEDRITNMICDAVQEIPT